MFRLAAMPKDFELELREYFDRSRGVGEAPDGQSFRWSNYAAGPARKHPASISRQRGSLGRRYFWITILVMAVLFTPIVIAVLFSLLSGGL